MPTPSRLGGSTGRFRSLLWKTSVEREIEAELAFHLEMRTREYVERGMDPEAAAAAARARLGQLAPVRAACRTIGRQRDRELGRAERLAELDLDLALAWRRLRGSPALALLCVLTLALALGAATAAFGAFDAVALRPLPFAAPDRLVRLREVDRQGGELAVSRTDYLAWWSARGGGAGTLAGALAGLAAFSPADRAVALPGGPERVGGVQSTASLFSLLGLRAARGRVFGEAEEGRGGTHDVVVLSDRLWRRLGGDFRLVGETLALDGQPFAVVGVLPAGAGFPAGIDLWTPLPLDGPAGQAGGARHELEALARLRPGVSAAAAGRALTAVPRAGGAVAVTAAPLGAWVAGAEQRSRVALALGAALLLGLLASASVANLLVSRAAARHRELALRAALGAGRRRILRQLASEGALLAGLAAVSSVPVAAGFVALLGRTGLVALPAPAGHLHLLPLAGRPLGFLAAAALAAALAVGLVPALAASRVDLAAAARSAAGRSAHRARRLRDLLVTLQIAVAMMLLVGSGLLAESFRRLRAVDPGFDADRVLAVRLVLGERYSPAARRALSAALEARLGRLPGVVAVGTTSFAPWSGARPDPPFPVARLPEPGSPAAARETLTADLRSVTPGFFRALGVPLLAGRFPAADGREAEVAVDRSLARRWWPGRAGAGAVEGAALGRRIELGAPARTYTVVGVVGELRDVAPAAPPRPIVFLPYARRPWRTLTLVIRTADDPALLAAAVRGEIGRIGWIGRDLPVVEMRPLVHGREAAVAGPRAILLLLALFAVLALALVALGVYDLLASGVGERQREIAVRMVLGASPPGVLRLVLSRGLLLAACGMAAGLAASALLARHLPPVLFEISPTDAAVYLATSAVLLGATLLAGLHPARRATRIAPAIALAGE